MTRHTFLKVATGGALTVMTAASLPQAADTIKVRIWHLPSGSMAISATSLKDVALMTIDEINAKGGVMGTKPEAVIADPALNWALLIENCSALKAAGGLRALATGKRVRRHWLGEYQAGGG